MKKIKIYFILLLLLGSSAVFSQVSRSVATEKSPAASPLIDPKLSPEEQALLLTAGEDNPAKIDEASMVDPKMDPRDIATEDDFGPSNAKPAEGKELDPKLEAEMSQKKSKETPVSVVQPASTMGQPAGDRNGTITDYRNMSGPKEQPRGEAPKSIPNYREMNGSGQQPAGDSPNK
jgi:hypothetical protein